MARELNQSEWRRDRNIRDQWGRLWLVTFETGPEGQGGSQMPTGQIMPAGWTDPLGVSSNAPSGTLRIPMGEFGEPDRNKLFCDLAPWLKVQKAAEREWKRNLNTVGMRHYKSAYNPATAEQDEFLTSVHGVGPKPWPPSGAIARALQGDKAMLGLVPLSKEDRQLLGRETDEDLGLASAPSLAEANPKLPPVPTHRTRKRMTYWKFAAKMKREGITEVAAVKAHWEAYKAEAATA